MVFSVELSLSVLLLMPHAQVVVSREIRPPRDAIAEDTPVRYNDRRDTRSRTAPRFAPASAQHQLEPREPSIKAKFSRRRFARERGTRLLPLLCFMLPHGAVDTPL